MGGSEPGYAASAEPRSAQDRIEQLVPPAPRQLFEDDTTYVHCGVDGWCYCFNAVGVFSRKWFPYVLSPSTRSESAVQSVLAAVEEPAPDKISGIRIRCDSGSQYASSESREAMPVLGIKAEHIRANTPRQNSHVESFYNTLKRDYVHASDFESFQDAAAWLAGARKYYNANRVHSSIGWVPPDESFRIWERNNRQEGAR